MSADVQHSIALARLVRYFILTSTTAAGSGHPSSSLSATDVLAMLMFGGFFRADLKKPMAVYNDRLIFSKGHAAPLLYALYAAAGVVSEKELLTLRQFGSRLEGHPTLAFPYTEAATGSLGQGLSIGVGMALSARLDGLDYRTYVLLGDSEMAEGSVWEALSCASHYKLTNLVAILDVNRLGQRGETMYGHHLEVYQARIEAFGWETIVVDGHNLVEINAALERVATAHKPTMIIARTIKGKGVAFIEDQEGWHGRALKADELTKALAELGPVDTDLRGSVVLPTPVKVARSSFKISKPQPYAAQEKISTRKAYGNALVKWFAELPDMVVLDAETSNSTYAETFKKAYPERFFEMYIAEQNMVGVALGLARRGKIPFVSTFAAFFSRAADQVRMAQYSAGNIKLVGSHAGVSIGEDGASQMGLEDLAFFRAVHQSVVLYPSDAVSTEALVGCVAKHQGLVYIRTTRKDTPILYKPSEKFVIGGSKTVRSSSKDAVTVVGAGVTLHEALAAYETLKKQGVVIRVLDLYSIKPLDLKTIRKALTETKALVVVEDHYTEGGIGEAIRSAFVEHKKPIISLAVTKLPKSGKPEELLAYEAIDVRSIVRAVKKVIV